MCLCTCSRTSISWLAQVFTRHSLENRLRSVHKDIMYVHNITLQEAKQEFTESHCLSQSSDDADWVVRIVAGLKQALRLRLLVSVHLKKSI